MNTNQNKVMNNILDQLNINKKLNKEIEEGIFEYKLRLDMADDKSKKKLAVQMLWRINEGKQLYNKYKAYYILGIKDSGNLGFITSDIIDKSIEVFKQITESVKNCVIENILYYNYDNYTIAIISIKKIFNTKIPEINLFFLGESNTYKTTFLANLCYNIIDDKNSKAVKYIVRHKHEQNSGITSSIHHEIIGIKDDNIINYKNDSLTRNNSWEDIYNNSDFIINLFDSPGNIKYSKTLFNNLLKINPNIILLFSEKYIELCKFLEINHYLIKNNDFTDLENIKNIKQDLVKMSKNNLINIKNLNNTYFIIYEIFEIKDLSTNIILSGYMVSGEININEEYYLNDIKIKIINIHNKTNDCEKISCCDSATIEIEILNNNICNINKNMVVHNNYNNLINYFDNKLKIKLVNSNLNINLELNKSYITLFSQFYNNKIKITNVNINVNNNNINNIVIDVLLETNIFINLFNIKKCILKIDNSEDLLFGLIE